MNKIIFYEGIKKNVIIGGLISTPLKGGQQVNNITF